MVDETDVTLAQKGDKAAFTRIIHACETSLYRVAKGILKHEEDCADAIQEAIIKSYHSIYKLKKPKNFQTWLTRILINQCYDQLKQRKRVVPMAHIEPTPLSKVQNELDDHLSEGIEKLTTKYRVIITLFYYEQYPIEEIAKILKIKEGTVKSRLYRARSMLASYLEKRQSTRRDENESKKNG